jgi:hypothetical protein
MDPPEPGRPLAGSRRWRGAGAGVALTVLAVAAVSVYIAREAIAERFARRWLAQHGVASSLQVRSLSLTGLSARLRLGDPADPDLTVERLDVGYALSGPWNGKPFGVETRSLRLVRPRLKIRLMGGHLDLGALDSVVREFSKRAPSGGAQPDVTVVDGVVLLLTSDGLASVRGGGELRAGGLTVFDGRVDPFRIAAFGAHLQGHGGVAHVARRGDRLIAALDLGPVAAVSGLNRLTVARATLSGELPYPTPKGLWVGPTHLALLATGVSVGASNAQADGMMSADLQGALQATAARQVFAGRLLATSHVTALTQTDLRARDATAQLDLGRLSLTHDPSGARLAGDGQASLAADAAFAAGAKVSALTSAVRVQGLRVVVGGGRLRASATLTGGLAGRGEFSDASAHRLAKDVPVLSGEAAYASAIERGLRGFRFSASLWRAELSDREVRLALGSPLRVDTDSGAHLALDDAGRGLKFGPRGARGAVELSLDGGGMPALKVLATNASIYRDGYRAEIAAHGALDALFARGADLQLKGQLLGSGPRLRFDLASCTPVRAQRLVFGANSVSGVAASLCPGGAPLIEADPRGWKAQGKLENARGDVASFAADLRRVTGAFGAAGVASRLDTVALVFDRGEIIDATEPIRFRPVNAAGRIDLAAGAWTGAFTAATRAGHPIGKIIIRHDVASGAGRADIDASALAFAPQGLQPADLTPLANFARDANGPAAFRGWFAWEPDGQTSSGGELAGKGLSFKSPLGPVLGIDSDLHFTSLSPLLTAPDQKIDIRLVQALTPLSDLSAQFDLGPSSISIDAADAGVAKGRVRLEPIVAPLEVGRTLSGVLVVDHVNIGELIAASSLADAVKVDAVVDGRIPFELGPSGLIIRQGRLAAIAPGRISISRNALTGGANSGAASASPADSGKASVAQDLAYQAMENLAFDTLNASVDSLPDDRLGMLFHIKGRHDPPQPQRATISLKDLVGGRALAKPIALPSNTKIDLTLDTSLNFGELVQALTQAWRDALGGSGAASRSAPVQGPDASVTAR